MRIPVGLSNRHVHLSKNDLDALFGEGYQLNNIKDLNQKGEFAAQETITIRGPKGEIENVRVVGPLRSKSQVEILKKDCNVLGVDAPIHNSGDLEGSSAVVLIHGDKKVELNEGLIIASRHLHVTEEYLKKYGFQEGQLVNVKVGGNIVFYGVIIRKGEGRTELHIDKEEGHGAALKNNDVVEIVTQ